MNKIFLILLFILSFQRSAGQSYDLLNAAENDYLKIRQRPGTESLLAKYVESAGVKEDTVYAFIYEPGDCPRCEAALKLYRQWFGKRNKKFMLITVFKDKSAAKAYNKEKGYAADYYLYDTEREFAPIFSFNNQQLSVSYLLKITKDGKLIYGREAGNDASERFVDMVIAQKEPMPCKSFGEELEIDENTEDSRVMSAIPINDKYKDYPLNLPEGITPCLANRNPYFNDNVFFYSDELLGGAMLFREKSKGKLDFEALMRPDSTEKTNFVKIKKDDYDNMLANGQLFSIICSPNILDRNTIGMSFSMPNLVYSGENRIDYYNEACILSRDLSTLKRDSIVNFNFNIWDESFFYKHFQFSSTGSRIILSCQKLTWPMEYEPEEYKDDVNRNSFDKGFYKTENPLIAVFNRKTGELIERFGGLDETAERSLTGYYFTDPVSQVNGSEMLYTDGYSGKVYVADTTDLKTIKACYKVFGFEGIEFPKIDSTKFYTYEYIKPYRNVYYRQIRDIRLTRDKLYAMVAYKSGTAVKSYSFAVVDRKSGKVEEYAYPDGDGYYVFTRGIRVIKDKAYPFEVLKDGDRTWIRVYHEKQD